MRKLLLDFTPTAFINLMKVSLDSGYNFLSMSEFFQRREKMDRELKFIILRHDIDKRPQNAERMAIIEHSMGIRGTYYFRKRSSGWEAGAIEKIKNLGHEIGYHYEDLSRNKGNHNNAWDDFKRNLSELRSLTPVNSISMHGSPMTDIDNKELWNHFDYRDCEIYGEPYLDIDFREVLYLTDTGRTWDSKKGNIRDKVVCNSYDLHADSTWDLINLLSSNKFPNKILFTIHPQRWEPFGARWLRELGMQKIKNLVKRFVAHTRK